MRNPRTTVTDGFKNVKKKFSVRIHMYIIGHYNPSNRITAKLITPLLLCALIFYMSGGTYNLTSSTNRQIFGKPLYVRFIYSQSFCQKYSEGKSLKKYFFFYISLLCLTWDLNSGLTSNKPTQYLLDYGNFYTIKTLHIITYLHTYIAITTLLVRTMV